MQRYRRLWIAALGFIFAAACLLWILHFPFQPAQVLRVVPPEAVAATWHRHPAERIEALLKSAPAALLMAAADVTAAEIRTVLESPGGQTLMARLGGEGATLAYAPAFGALREPALILGAWVGGVTTHWMRAGLMDESFEGYTMHRVGRDRLWIGSFPDLPFGMRYVSFGVYEGVLAGCASSDPFAAISLLAALRRHGPLAQLVSPWLDHRGGIKAETQAEDDIFRVHSAAPATEPTVFSGSFRLREDGALTGRLVLEESGALAFRQAFARELPDGAGMDVLDTLPPLPADAPAVLTAATVERGLAAAAAFLPPVWRERLLLAPLAELAVPGGACLAWISGGAYSGRIMRMKIPGIGIAMQVPAETGIEKASARLADAVNAIYGAGLIAVPDRTDRRIHALQPVKDAGAFGLIRPEELPAVALADGWLMAMTNVEALRRLLARMDGQPPGRIGRGETESAWLYGSASLPDAASAASGALAGYALLRLMQTGQAERLDTPAVRRLLAAMENAGALSLRAGHDADGRLAADWSMDGTTGGTHD